MNAIVLFWVTTNGDRSDRLPTSHEPLSFRDGVTITKSSVTQVSSPIPPRRPLRLDGDISSGGKHCTNVLELDDLSDLDYPGTSKIDLEGAGGEESPRMDVVRSGGLA